MSDRSKTRGDTGREAGRPPWRLLGWGAAGLILLVPLAAMPLTDEVNWTASDFLLAGGLLLVAGLGLVFACRQASLAYRAASALAVAAGFLLIWLNGAVGIIGDEGNPANLVYGGVLVVALLGAAVARLRAGGLSKAMTATAIAQATTPVGALALGAGTAAVAWEVWGLTAGFTALWLAASWLYRRAALGA